VMDDFSPGIAGPCSAHYAPPSICSQRACLPGNCGV